MSDAASTDQLLQVIDLTKEYDTRSGARVTALPGVSMTLRNTETGVLRSTVSEHLSPINAAQLRQAHAWVESGRMRGKLVVSGF